MLTDMYAYFYGEKKMLPDEFDDYLDYSQVAVVSIDMHRGHLEDSPDCPCPGPRGREVIQATDNFHRECRALGIPVIHVEMKLRSDGSDDRLGVPAAWRRLFPMTTGEIKNADQHNLEGTRWLEFVTEVKPEDYIVDTKKRLSAFYPTDLEFLLRNLKKDIVVITGIFTDGCDLNTGFDASNRGFKVVFPANITRGYSEELEEAAKKIFSLYLGLVVDDCALVKEWQARYEQDTGLSLGREKAA